MKELFDELETLLRKYQHVYQANLAMTAGEAEQRAPGSGIQQMDSEEWWGNSKSVAAIDLAIDGGFTPESRRDAAALRKALVELYQLMADQGLSNDQGEIMAAQFKKWLASQV